MMKKCMLLCLCLLCLATVACAEDVASIKVKDMPTKTSYFVKEAFSAEGGTITVKYADGSTEVMDMTNPDVEIEEPSTSRTGSKSVTVKYGGKKTSFKIKVVAKGMTVTFHMNCDEADIEQNVTKGYTALEEEAPARAGFTFVNWYADEDCTVLFNFDQAIEADTDVYAMWTDDAAIYHEVCFDMNYYGCAESRYPQLVKDGESAKLPAVEPERVDYAFSGWYTDSDCATAFDAAAPVAQDQTVYAGWNKVKTGSSVYTFEAEDVDLSQKAGPGYSGENAGIGMIVTNKDTEASGDKFVAYQCKNGNSLEFNVACDEDCDAVLYVRLAAEFSDMDLTPDKYQIAVNGEAVQYDPIHLALAESAQQGVFEDYQIGKIALKKGENLIQLKTTNTDALGGTLTATAPIIDCVKVETQSVVIWDGTYGLPRKNY